MWAFRRWPRVREVVTWRLVAPAPWTPPLVQSAGSVCGACGDDGRQRRRSRNKTRVNAAPGRLWPAGLSGARAHSGWVDVMYWARTSIHLSVFLPISLSRFLSALIPNCGKTHPTIPFPPPRSSPVDKIPRKSSSASLPLHNFLPRVLCLSTRANLNVLGARGDPQRLLTLCWRKRILSALLCSAPSPDPSQPWRTLTRRAWRKFTAISAWTRARVWRWTKSNAKERSGVQTVRRCFQTPLSESF